MTELNVGIYWMVGTDKWDAWNNSPTFSVRDDAIRYQESMPGSYLFSGEARINSLDIVMEGMTLNE